MRSVLAYTPHRGSLSQAGPVAATLFVLAPAVVAFTSANPIVLLGALGAALATGWAAGAWSAAAAGLRWAAALGVLIIAVNAIASQRGETILVRGWELPLLGRLDVSAEALAEGGVLALRIAVVLVAFAVHTACVDPDRLLRLLRPLARRSALTASLIVRMAPLASADHARLREAAALRGPAAAPVDRPALVRRMVGGALDRAIDSAATLELRGYASPARARPPSPGRHRRSLEGSLFAAAAIAMLAAAIVVRLAGGAGYRSYPLVAVDAGALTLALTLAMALLALAPFALARRRPAIAARPSEVADA